MKPLQTRIVGVTGGSGSGKTTFARSLMTALGESDCAILYQDRYYIDQSARFTGDESVNFDHPNAIDFKLLRDHLLALKSGSAVDAPIYDFSTHTRSPSTDRIEARAFVILDGHLILSQEIIRSCLDLSFFVECPEKIRYERRLRRDVRERGREPEGVKKMFDKFVKPMHDLYIEPSKTHAAQVLSGEAPFAAAVAKWAKALRA